MTNSEPLKFTIILPLHRDPTFLPYSIESVLRQTEKSFELFIICDGAPIETIVCAKEFAQRDSRIRVFVFEKGQRFGETHRHTALLEAKGKFIAHIQDDDIWFPNHLREMDILLQEVDFGHVIHAYKDSDQVLCVPGHLDNSFIFDKLSAPENKRFSICGLSVTGYRLEAYRNLPIGWSPAPDDMDTALHMWKKFYAQKGLKFGTRMSITSMKFPATLRDESSKKMIALEMREWLDIAQSQIECDKLSQMVLKKVSGDLMEHIFAVAAMREDLLTLEKTINNLQNQINNNYKINQETIDSLHDRINNMDDHISNIYKSKSWKITWPLRVLKHRLLAIIQR